MFQSEVLVKMKNSRKMKSFEIYTVHLILFGWFKSRSLRTRGLCIWHGEMRNIFRILFGKSELERTFRRYSNRWEAYIKRVIDVQDAKVQTGLNWFRIGPNTAHCKQCIGSLGCMEIFEGFSSCLQEPDSGYWPIHFNIVHLSTSEYSKWNFSLKDLKFARQWR